MRHVGDLGNVKADGKGVAQVDMKDKQIQLLGHHSVVGRSMVVHEKVDDLGKGAFLCHDTQKGTSANLGLYFE